MVVNEQIQEVPVIVLEEPEHCVSLGVPEA